MCIRDRGAHTRARDAPSVAVQLVLWRHVLARHPPPRSFDGQLGGLRRSLAAALSAHDADDSGLLERHEAHAALSGAGSGDAGAGLFPGADAAEIDALLALFDAENEGDDANAVEVSQLCDWLIITPFERGQYQLALRARGAQ